MKREDRAELIPLSRALVLLGIGDSCYRACEKNSTLPTSIKLSARTQGLYAHELEALIAACNDGATTEQMRELVSQIHEERALAKNFKRYMV